MYVPLMTSCEDANKTRHFARTVGDILPCGHVARRANDGSLTCSTPVLPAYYGEPINTPSGHKWAGYSR